MKHTPFFKTRLTKEEFRRRETAMLKALNSFKKLQEQTPEERVQHRENTLKRLLHHALNNIPFYSKLYDAAKFHPDQFRSMADLTRVPKVTKTMLRNATRSELAPPESPDNRHSHYLSTSGSTGEPVGLYKSDHAMWMFMAAAFYRYQQWCGDKPIQNVLYILDDKPGNIDYTLGDLLRTLSMEDRFVSSFSNVEAIWDALDHFRPEYISTYPSVMRNLSLYILSLRNRSRVRKIPGNACPYVKLLNLTSEMLDSHTRHLIGQVFPAACIVETYTSTEAGFMGYQCLDKGGFHLSEELGIYELHPVNNAIEDDQSEAEHMTHSRDNLHKVVVTDLTNFATPLIRYSGLGDLVTPAVDKCQCGSRHQRIKSLQGRVVDSIKLPDGSRVTPYVLTNIVSDTPGIQKYQIIQTTAQTFTVKVVTGPDAPSQANLQTCIQAAFRKTLRNDAICTIEPVDDIKPKPGQHKVPLVISS